MIKQVLREANVEVIASQIAKQGKSLCGDDFFFEVTEEYFICVLADGLGSGEFAYESSGAVTEIVKQYHHEDIELIMQKCNDVLAHKRGAAVSIFKVFFKQNLFVYSGVGNIRFFFYTPSGKLVYPLPVTGYLSGKRQRYHTQQFEYETPSKFFMHSDGFELKGSKSFLRHYQPLEETAIELEKLNAASIDDSTFIMGSLL